MAELVIEPTAVAQCDSHSCEGGVTVSVDMLMLQRAGSVAAATKIAAAVGQASYDNQNHQDDQALCDTDAKQHKASFA
jgi:hypothetical protein